MEALPDPRKEPGGKRKIIVHPDQVHQPDKRPWDNRSLEAAVGRYLMASMFFVAVAALAIGLALGLIGGGR